MNDEYEHKSFWNNKKEPDFIFETWDDKKLKSLGIIKEYIPLEIIFEYEISI